LHIDSSLIACLADWLDRNFSKFPVRILLRVGTKVQAEKWNFNRLPQSGYRAPQHFLYFLPLPQGHNSLRPAFTSGGRIPGTGSRCRTASFASGARLCRKKRFNPAHK
jgi:hypothetical protein